MAVTRDAVSAAAPAVSVTEFLVDLLIGAVIFVLVCIVAAILMFLLQAVLPGGPAAPPPVDGDHGHGSSPVEVAAPGVADAGERQRPVVDETGTA